MHTSNADPGRTTSSAARDFRAARAGRRRRLRAIVAVGHTPGPVPEHLMDLVHEDSKVELRVPIVKGCEGHIESALGVADLPRIQGVVPVIAPFEVFADLDQPTVDDDSVLGESGAVGPLASDLETNQFAAGGKR